MTTLKGLGRLKKPKLIIPIAIVILLAAALVMIVHNLNAPAVGDIDQASSAVPERMGPFAQPGTYHGKYISFAYPAHFKKIALKQTGSSLEVADFHTTDITSKQIAVEVRTGSIAASGDIQYRRQNQAIYKENDSQKWIEFTKLDGTEDTFFLEHNGHLASVSATAPGGGLNGEAFFVAGSLKWL
jgi:hypothetical protein